MGIGIDIVEIQLLPEKTTTALKLHTFCTVDDLEVLFIVLQWWALSGWWTSKPAVLYPKQAEVQTGLLMEYDPDSAQCT